MIRRVLDGLYLFAGYAAGLFMIAIFVLMMVLSAGRPLGINIPAGDDIVSWCMAAMAFLGLAHTFRHGEMIRVGLVIDLLSGRPRWIVEIIALIIGCGFTGFFAWHASAMTYDSWRFHDMAQGVLAVPLWIPQLGYSGGLVILFVAFVDELIYVGTGHAPRYEKPKPQTAEEVVEQAIQSGV
jgi:TRAP-type C4-dicarboxylate transport system permease small subunit